MAPIDSGIAATVFPLAQNPQSKKPGRMTGLFA
jgi:hypothetical protein